MKGILIGTILIGLIITYVHVMRIETLVVKIAEKMEVVK